MTSIAATTTAAGSVLAGVLTRVLALLMMAVVDHIQILFFQG